MAIVDWVFLGLYFALLIVIGVQTIRRIETPEDFAVAGNRIIWPVFFGSLAASFLGEGSSLGNAGETFKDGYVCTCSRSSPSRSRPCWLATSLLRDSRGTRMRRRSATSWRTTTGARRGS